MAKMKIYMLSFMLLTSLNAFSQWKDDFTDGDLTKNPSWDGKGFLVNKANQLQTASSTLSQTVQLTLPSNSAVNTSWEFNVELQFDPSTTNQLRIYLISDQLNLSGPLNGYFLQIGESGNTDSYDLYQQKGTSISKIVDGPAKPRASTDKLAAHLKVSCDAAGKWEIHSETGGVFKSEGTVVSMPATSKYFGIQCKYTATRSDKFFF